jgi:hypothetical protein
MARHRIETATGRGGRAMRRLGLALLLALAFVAVGPGSARAANVRYAAPSGGGPQPCLESAPCSLQLALTGTGKDGVHEGDAVVVEPGTYHLAGGISFEHVGSVGGQVGAPLPLIESVGGFALEPGGAVDVHDLRINQPSGQGTGLILLNGATAERVYVTNDEGGAGSQACFLFGTVALRDSLCENLDQAGEGAGVAASTGSSSTSTATLDNVTAVGQMGISVRADGGSKMTVDGTNVIASGRIDDLHLRTDSSAGTSSTIKLSHSDFSTHAAEGTGNTFTSPSARQNQSAKPLFVNAAAGDFHEAPGSPTIATGDLTVVEPGELDLDQAPRSGPLTCGAAPTVDIGTYQSRPGDCTPPPTASPAPSPPSSPPGSEPAVAPVLRSLSLSHRSFAVAGRHQRQKGAPLGTTVRFDLSEPAAVTIEVLAKRQGHRRGSACVATRKQGPPCVRQVSVGSLRALGQAGENRVRFDGHLGGRTLAPGRYVMRISASAAGLRSGTLTLGFTIEAGG